MLTKIVLLFMVLLGASFAQGEPLCLSISEGLDRMCARDVAADLSCARVPKSLAWIADSRISGLKSVKSDKFRFSVGFE